MQTESVQQVTLKHCGYYVLACHGRQLSRYGQLVYTYYVHAITFVYCILYPVRQSQCNVDSTVMDLMTVYGWLWKLRWTSYVAANHDGVTTQSLVCMGLGAWEIGGGVFWANEQEWTTQTGVFYRLLSTECSILLVIATIHSSSFVHLGSKPLWIIQINVSYLVLIIQAGGLASLTPLLHVIQISSIT